MKQEYKLLTLCIVLMLLSLAVLGCAKNATAEVTASPSATATAAVTGTTTEMATVTATPATAVTDTAAPSVYPTSTPMPEGSSTAERTSSPTNAITYLPYITPTAAPYPTTTVTPAKTPAPTPVNNAATQWVMKELSFQSTKAYTASSTSATYETGFESASVPSGWINFGGTGIAVSSDVHHSGAKSLCLSGRKNAWDSPAFNIYSTVKTGGAGYYTISFWVYIDIAAASSAGGMVIRGDGNDENSFIANSNGSYFGAISESSTTTPAKTWVEYVGVVNVLASDITRSSSADTNFNVMLHVLNCVSGQKLYIDDFSIEKGYSTTAFGDTEMDVIFTGPGNTTLTVPAFWDGGSTWKVRFAPTKVGTWTYRTVCSDTANAGLHNKTGSLTAVAYTGNLEIYKHGFIKTTANTRYFTYADGTPFFYLGDTHWNMAATPFDTSEVEGIASTFKYIVDKRVAQGFTVYQSEPIGAQYSLGNGLSQSDLAGFADLDRRFAYIAEKGMVHANAQLFFASELGANIAKYPDSYLEKLCRYWVARYGAFPVMWTTAQECDNDFYYSASGSQNYFDATTNPWKKVAAWVYENDPYKHPGTAHQEYSGATNASSSSFRNLTCHKWYAAQWSPAKNAQLDFKVPKDYWNNGQGKPTVNYEGHYDHLWTNEYGARMQGWTAYLNGMYGQGYGAIDIWLYNSTYNADVPSTNYGITITVADKAIKWYDSINFSSAYQLGYMRSFFNTIEWWKLTPWFDTSNKFTNDGSWYSIASDGSDVIVAYFYNNTNKKTGSFKNLTNGAYTMQWYNPVTGSYSTVPTTINITDGTYVIGGKPSNDDYVLLLKRK